MSIVGAVPQMEAEQVEKMMNNNMQVCLYFSILFTKGASTEECFCHTKVLKANNCCLTELINIMSKSKWINLQKLDTSIKWTEIFASEIDANAVSRFCHCSNFLFS